jgi:predicted RNA binding protein YcfA (HicA-like mRNA interferase family)
MKRRYLLKHLARHGCKIVREGGRHTIVRNLATGAESQVPRHREIKTATAKGICKDLGIESPSEA